MSDINEYDYEFSDAELAELEEIYAAYDEMLKREEQENPSQIGYCGFSCNFGCPSCMDCGYDGNDET